MNAARKLLPYVLLSLPLLAADLALDPNAPRDLNTPRTFPEMLSRGEWQKRAEEIREHVQFATGLWPMPEKTPLNERIFGRVERDGSADLHPRDGRRGVEVRDPRDLRVPLELRLLRAEVLDLVELGAAEGRLEGVGEAAESSAAMATVAVIARA